MGVVVRFCQFVKQRRGNENPRAVSGQLQGDAVPAADRSAVPPVSNGCRANPPRLGDGIRAAKAGDQLRDRGNRIVFHGPTVQNVLPRVNTPCFGARGTVLLMDRSKEAIGQRLKEARTKKGYESVADAARAFGFNEGMARSNENGNRGPGRKMLKRYADAYGVDFEWLETGQKTAMKRLDQTELTLIEAWRRMIPEQRSAFFQLAVSTAPSKLIDKAS